MNENIVLDPRTIRDAFKNTKCPLLMAPCTPRCMMYIDAEDSNQIVGYCSLAILGQFMAKRLRNISEDLIIDALNRKEEAHGDSNA